jgi:hypothetical protein
VTFPVVRSLLAELVDDSGLRVILNQVQHDNSSRPTGSIVYCGSGVFDPSTSVCYNQDEEDFKFYRECNKLGPPIVVRLSGGIICRVFVIFRSEVGLVEGFRRVDGVL